MSNGIEIGLVLATVKFQRGYGDPRNLNFLKTTNGFDQKTLFMQNDSLICLKSLEAFAPEFHSNCSHYRVIQCLRLFQPA